MYTSLLILYVCVSTVISTCPPESGIYLILNGECRSNGTYFRDSDLDISKPNSDNYLHCVLPDETLDDGEWLRPDGEPVNCIDDAKPDPFVCNKTISPNANITLYLNDNDDFAPLAGGNDQHNVELQYKCCLPTNCSDRNTNIMIINVFERVYITDIYVDLPFDITVIPQYYTIHCVVTGSYVATVTHYYDNTQVTESYCNDHGCSFKNETLHTSNFTYDLSVKWKIGEYGDHYHKCNAQNGQIMREAIVKVTAPTSSPSIPTLVNNTFTSITINWTYPDISDTDGYVVNASSLNDYVIQQVNGSSVNETTLNGLIPGTTYNITIRAYQDLLGPASQPLSVDTLNVTKVSETSEYDKTSITNINEVTKVSPTLEDASGISPSITNINEIPAKSNDASGISPFITKITEVSPTLEDASVISPSITNINEIPAKSNDASGISPSITKPSVVQAASEDSYGICPSICTCVNEADNCPSNDCSAVSGTLGTLVSILAVALIGCITAIIILSVLYIKQRNKDLSIHSKIQATKTKDDDHGLHLEKSLNTDYEIPHDKIEMQVCEPYGLHKITTPNTVIYEECNPSDVSVYETI